MGDDNFWADTINLLVVGAILIIMALIMSFNQRNKKMTQSDKAKQWVAENAKAFDCWNRHVEEHGLPLAEFSPLGQESDETILHLTDEQIPRFVEAAKAGKGLPPDIVESFMSQLFPNDQPAYEPDEGPLTEAEFNQIRAQAAPKLGKGPVLRRRSLLEKSDD